MAYFRSHNVLSSYDARYGLERDADDEDEYYMDKLLKILSGPPYLGVPPQPTAVLPNIYLGTQANAENLDLIKRLKFKFILNCAGSHTTLRNRRAHMYPPEVTYKELPIEDSEDFNLTPYLNDAHAFIERSALRGRVLVHCTGVSRSGAIMLSFMVGRGMQLLRATRELKNDRRNVCTNQGFMRDVLTFARSRGLLDGEPEKVHAPRYGRQIDKTRMNSAHLPIIY